MKYDTHYNMGRPWKHAKEAGHRYHTIPSMWNIQNSQIYEDRKEICLGGGGWEWGRKGSVYSAWVLGGSEGDENVLNL